MYIFFITLEPKLSQIIPNLFCNSKSLTAFFGADEMIETYEIHGGLRFDRSRSQTPRSPWGKGNIAPAQALMEVGLICLTKKRWKMIQGWHPETWMMIFFIQFNELLYICLPERWKEHIKLKIGWLKYQLNYIGRAGGTSAANVTFQCYGMLKRPFFHHCSVIV